MSIANSITGGGASNQLMDLLAVVANPDVYKAKIDALESATAENKKYVEAIGPASEIVALRDEAKAKAQEAQEALEKAKGDAAQIKESADAQAKVTLVEAQRKADAMVYEASQAKEKADAALVEAAAKLKQAEKATEDADKARSIAESKAAELEQAIADAQSAEADARATKAAIIAKHQSFIAGL